MKIFEPLSLGNLTLKNRIIRSGTFEGMADSDGYPQREYHNLYKTLSVSGPGALITGFTYISKEGKAMQPGQAGIDDDNKIPLYKQVTTSVHEQGSRIFMQIAHTGRQTSAEAVGGRLLGASSKKSFYFGGTPRAMTEQEAVRAIEDFGDAARRTRDSGFDGVQIHGAHGYLIHQFLLPSINNRRDRFGIDPSTGIGTAFLGAVLDNVRKKCGEDYPILLKVSGGDDYLKKFTPSMFTNHIKFIDMKGVDAIEVSYGTMDYALNIFRGATLPVDTILKYNPKYKTTNPLLKTLFKGLVFPLVSTRFKPLTTAYNLPYSRAVKAITQIPVITVGGFRTGTEISEALENSQTDFVSLCRPFIREPDFLVKLTTDPLYRSLCTGCNKCAIMCDSKFSTRCYSKNHNERVKAAGDPAKEISHGS